MTSNVFFPLGFSEYGKTTKRLQVTGQLEVKLIAEHSQHWEMRRGLRAITRSAFAKLRS